MERQDHLAVSERTTGRKPSGKLNAAKATARSAASAAQSDASRVLDPETESERNPEAKPGSRTDTERPGRPRTAGKASRFTMRAEQTNKKSTGHIPWRDSSRFKLVLFSIILVAYGAVFTGLLIANSLHYASVNRRLARQRSDYYEGSQIISQVNVSLSNLLNSSGEDAETSFQGNVFSLQAFANSLLADPDLVYEYDLGLMYRHYLESAQNAASLRMADAESADMLLAYNETADIYTTIQNFTFYPTAEMESNINVQLANARSAMISRIRWILVFLALATAAIIVLVVWFSRYFLHPVEELSDIIRTSDSTSWRIRQAPTSRRDEMGLLYKVFFEMMNQIRRQYDELIQKQLLEQQLHEEQEKNIRGEALLARTKLKVFQSQINSHFLFNTLNMISGMAYIEEAPRTQHASELLARFLRSVLSQFSKTIPLSEEFETVSQYVEIQKLRFGDRIVFEDYLDEDLPDMKVPAMTIQPMVENAIIHGVAGREKGYIRYSAEVTDKGVLISVFDDGTGMSEKDASALVHKVESSGDQRGAEILTDEEARHGIGLINVYRRINLLYPGRVHFIVKSEENEYTTIGILIRGQAP